MIRHLCVLALVAGCSTTARTPATYRSDTEQLLASRHGVVKACYDAALARDRVAAGTVTVTFVVEKRTGAIRQASVIPERSRGSSQLYACVLDALAGLRLAPGDRNEAHATFVYELRPSPS